ncbi:MAG: biotin carboxylase N-terminal domain-containing protein [Nannocystaceae bacterium]
MSGRRIDTLLVANRGEIALRVMRTARAMGIATVAVYSEADADAPHVAFADAAVCIGEPAVRSSYLSIDRILDAASRAGADAIHPGYGFLSENAVFAERCEAAGITFVGPPANAIRLMGDKVQAKLRMIEAGVPTAPAYMGSTDDLARLSAEADRIGYPLLVKASAGGGGRGMRIVREAGALHEAVAGASSEAASAFGSGQVFLERLVEGARHIEIQVFCDRRGGAIHLGERECSVQRRHQKIIEEAPSPAVTAALRAAMGEAAVTAARSIGYVGAGTVEFLLDDRDAARPSFYFLEMNTRLQVEHPVTELVTGQDLVQWQLRVAEGAALPLSQSEVALRGHAIEVRLYAEDPYAGFVPQTGTVLRFSPSQAASARVDAGIRDGSVVSPFYDPMLAKIIGHGATRDEAIRATARAVRDSVTLGLQTNRGFLLELLGSRAFADAEIRTDTLDARFRDERPPRPQPSARAWAVAAIACAAAESGAGWRSSGEYPATIELRCGDAARRLTVASAAGGWVTVTGAAAAPMVLRVCARAHGRVAIELDGVRRWPDVVRSGDEVWLDDDGHAYGFVEPVLGAEAEVAAGSDGRVRAPMGGRVVSVLVEVGARVQAGGTLAVIEAMKMEHKVVAPHAGVVRTLSVTAGGQVTQRAVIAEIEPETAG